MIKNKKNIMKLTLQKKIFLWFVIIILISFILYGLLIYFVYSYNLRGERYIISITENLKGVDLVIIEKLREVNRLEPFGIPPHLKILPPRIFTRIFYTITGGVLAIIIISVSGGYLVLRRMLNQVNMITENVKEIDEKKLHLRLNFKGKDAISNMAKVFDSMLDKIEISFNKQKQFVQNASHELNTPLTIMKTKIDVMRQKKNITKEEYRETIDMIDDEVIRLSKITEELLTLSEIEENGAKDKFTEINIRKVIVRILKLFRNQLVSKDIKLKEDYRGNFLVLGDEAQIEQLFFNLIDNAVKYSSNGKELGIRLGNDIGRKSLICSIENISEVVKEEDIPHIFERFYKTSYVKGKKSFGLGLSISKKIVENHDGKIEVNYDKDKMKITFRIYLPLK